MKDQTPEIIHLFVYIGGDLKNGVLISTLSPEMQLNSIANYCRVARERKDKVLRTSNFENGIFRYKCSIRHGDAVPSRLRHAFIASKYRPLYAKVLGTSSMGTMNGTRDKIKERLSKSGITAYADVVCPKDTVPYTTVQFTANAYKVDRILTPYVSFNYKEHCVQE